MDRREELMDIVLKVLDEMDDDHPIKGCRMCAAGISEAIIRWLSEHYVPKEETEYDGGIIRGEMIMGQGQPKWLKQTIANPRGDATDGDARVARKSSPAYF